MSMPMPNLTKPWTRDYVAEHRLGLACMAPVDLDFKADCNARLIERWRSGDERPEILTEEIAWQPDPAALPLVIDLPTYFREVWEPA